MPSSPSLPKNSVSLLIALHAKNKCQFVCMIEGGVATYARVGTGVQEITSKQVCVCMFSYKKTPPKYRFACIFSI